MKAIIRISDLDSPGAGLADVLGDIVCSDGTELFEQTASGIDITGTPASTSAAIASAFADIINASISGASITASDILLI